MIVAMHAWAESHDGMPPTLLDWSPSLARHADQLERAERFEREGCWPRSQVVERLFGSWNAAIVEAGFTPMRQGYSRSRGEDGVYWKRERLLDAVNRWCERYGDAPTARDWNATHQRERGDAEALQRLAADQWPSLPTVYAQFVSFEALVAAAGYEPRIPALVAAGYQSDRWSREIVLDTIRRFAEIHGAAPSVGDTSKFSTRAVEHAYKQNPPTEPIVVLPTLPVVLGYFGSWNEAIEAAGCTPRLPGETRKWGSHEQPYWSRERIVRRLREWAELHGSPPTNRDWKASRDRWPSTDTVRRRFGAFNTALEVAGFPPRVSRFEVSWTRDMVLDAIREWITTHGRSPLESDWNGSRIAGTPPSSHGTPSQPWPSAATVRRTFGSWTLALTEAGHPPQASISWTREMIVDAVREWTTHHGKPPRQADWKSLASKDLTTIGQCSHGTTSQPWPSCAAVYRTLGSWPNALRAGRAND